MIYALVTLALALSWLARGHDRAAITLAVSVVATHVASLVLASTADASALELPGASAWPHWASVLAVPPPDGHAGPLEWFPALHLAYPVIAIGLAPRGDIVSLSVATLLLVIGASAALTAGTYDTTEVLAAVVAAVLAHLALPATRTRPLAATRAPRRMLSPHDSQGRS